MRISITVRDPKGTSLQIWNPVLEEGQTIDEVIAYYREEAEKVREKFELGSVEMETRILEIVREKPEEKQKES